MKKTFLFLILLILIVPIVMSGGYNEYAPIGYLNNNFCKLNGICTFNTITTEAIITGNLSVIGEVFNVTMNLVTWNITESFNVGGDLTARNGTFDYLKSGNITISTGVNANPTLKYREGTIDNGFDIMMKLYSTNYLEFNALDDGTLTTRFKIRRTQPEIESYSSIDFQNDYNITNLDCLEFNNNYVCDWDEVNKSIEDINITEGTGEHWWNETDEESSDFTTTGKVTTNDLNVIGTTTLENGTMEFFNNVKFNRTIDSSNNRAILNIYLG